jgi:hypothetical protein
MMAHPPLLCVEFDGTIWFWRGPAPWYFVTVPEEPCRELKAVAGVVTYGWGMIPVDVTIGHTTYYTALWPRDSSYIVPVKANVRKAEALAEGDTVTVRLEVR